MNSAIVKADLDSIREYKGKSAVAKIKGRKYQAYFRLDVDDFNLSEAVEYAKTDKNVLMLAYSGAGFALKSQEGAVNGVYIGWLIPVGNNVTEEDIQGYLKELPEGVSIVFQFPEDYKDLEFMVKMMEKYPAIRICGGHTFCFDDCRFGCCGRDVLTRAGIAFDKTDYLREGCSCAVGIYELSDVSLSAASRGSDKSNMGTKKQSGTQKAKKSQQFSSLLYSGGKVEL